MDDFKPPRPEEFRKSRNEDEYFLKLDAELIKAHRARLDAERHRAELRATHNHCPKCDGILKEVKHGHILIDICPSCKGVWLDAGELAQIVKLEKGALDKLFSVFSKE